MAMPSFTEPAQQRASMKQAFPNFVGKPNRRGGFTWHGTLQPTLTSMAYRIKIVHDHLRAPKVFLPRVHFPPGTPHIYNDQSLCLYWPEEWQWSATERLADTIVPWTALWLYFFEGWRVTGRWLGPESPHGSAKTTNEAAMAEESLGPNQEEP